MSDTPRTDEVWSSTYQCEERLHFLALQLEKELNAAQARFAELEESQKTRASCINGMNNALYMRDQRIAELEKRIKSMKCCDNCDVWEPACNAVGLVIDFDKCWKGIETTPPKYRCADRDDGCGHCERSEPHEHPDEQQGNECDRRGGEVTCEVVT
jgi:hypothetical protein